VGLVAEMAGRRQVFQGSPELQRFVLPKVRPTGRQLGVGSYGSVEEVDSTLTLAQLKTTNK